MDIYQSALRPFLFSVLKADPEWVQQQTLRALSELSDATALPIAWLRSQLQQTCEFSAPGLEQQLWGLTFRNPIGLAAGFDKDGIAAGIWSSLGFGSAELGTVTYHAQPGNPPPRLFRLPLDRAAINRMGFNNRGAAALAETLAHVRQSQAAAGQPTIPLGINLGKSKATPLAAAAADYLSSFQLLQAWGDYFVVNVSSPNTPGLRSLQATDQLEPILEALQGANLQQKPLLVKIAPDLDWEDIVAIVGLAQTYRLAGIIATNTTLRRDQLKTQVVQATGQPITAEAGGLSGAPLRQRSTEIIRFIWQNTQGTLPIIGVGGIFTAEDAWEKITAGASLVQVYTGWVYEGPWMVRRLLMGLADQLEAQGLISMTEAVGVANKTKIS